MAFMNMFTHKYKSKYLYATTEAEPRGILLIKNVDERQKTRLMFDSLGTYHRQLLVGADTHALNQFDIDYDALLNEKNTEDMYWSFLNNQFIIQAINNFDKDQTLPLGVNINEEEQATIRIEELINITT